MEYLIYCLQIKVFLSDKMSINAYLSPLHGGSWAASTWWRVGRPGKDDTYHVNPIAKIRVSSFNRIR